MPSIGGLDIAPRRELNVFYVLDTSGSMDGLPIHILNRAMEETINVLRQMADHNGDARLKISVLEFSTNAKWMQPNGPEDVEDFIWTNLTAGGLTNVGAALDELNDKLSTSDFLHSMTGSLLPIIIFMTDGYATDEYEKKLEEIRKNKLFRRATRIGFAIGENADTEMIAHLAGDSEAVVRSDDLALFARLLRFVSVTSSMLCSQSQVTGAETKGKDALAQAIEMAGISRSDVGTELIYHEDPFDSQEPQKITFDWEDDDDF